MAINTNLKIIMSQEAASITPTFIIYLVSILAIGLYFLRREYIRESFGPIALNAPAWKGSWLDFGTMFWCIMMIYVLAPQAGINLFTILKLGDLNEITRPLVGGLTSQLGIFLFMLSMPFIYSSLLGGRINNATCGAGGAIREGVKSFFVAIPLVWATSFFWNLILKIWKTLDFPIDIENQTLVTLFSESSSWQFMTIMIFFAVVIAPVSEEYIFRVVIYRFLKKTWGIHMAFIGSGILFGAVHFNLASFLPLFMVGMLLTRAYERTGNVLTSILFHGLFNLNTLILLMLQPDGFVLK